MNCKKHFFGNDVGAVGYFIGLSDYIIFMQQIHCRNGNKTNIDHAAVVVLSVGILLEFLII